MKRALFAAVGALIALAGTIWTLQGIGILRGSVMSGKALWAVIGPLATIAGVLMIVGSMRRSGRSAR
jgi:hypothetical protein